MLNLSTSIPDRRLGGKHLRWAAFAVIEAWATGGNRDSRRQGDCMLSNDADPPKNPRTSITEERAQAPLKLSSRYKRNEIKF